MYNRNILSYFTVMKRELLTVPQYAAKIGLKRDSVYKQIQEGRLGNKAKLKEIGGRKFIQTEK